MRSYDTYEEYIIPKNTVRIVLDKVLEKVAEHEKEARPYQYRTSGVSGSDINSEYVIEEWMLRKLEQLGYLKRVYDGIRYGKYRVTDKGWKKVDIEKPATSFDIEDHRPWDDSE